MNNHWQLWLLFLDLGERNKWCMLYSNNSMALIFCYSNIATISKNRKARKVLKKNKKGKRNHPIHLKGSWGHFLLTFFLTNEMIGKKAIITGDNNGNLVKWIWNCILYLDKDLTEEILEVSQQDLQVQSLRINCLWWTFTEMF